MSNMYRSEVETHQHEAVDVTSSFIIKRIKQGYHILFALCFISFVFLYFYVGKTHVDMLDSFRLDSYSKELIYQQLSEKGKELGMNFVFDFQQSDIQEADYEAYIHEKQAAMKKCLLSKKNYMIITYVENNRLLFYNGNTENVIINVPITSSGEPLRKELVYQLLQIDRDVLAKAPLLDLYQWLLKWSTWIVLLGTTPFIIRSYRRTFRKKK